jgi:hypothetical protein
MTTLRKKMEGLFSAEMLKEQRRLMGFEVEHPLRESTELTRRGRFGFVQEEEDDGVDTGLHHTEIAHERSRAAHQASSFHPALPAPYVAHMHAQARDAHQTAHSHWQQVAKAHSDMHVRQQAKDLSKEHGEVRDSHHARSAPAAEPKSEPEVFMRRRSA